MEENYITFETTYSSEWKCELFGLDGQITVIPKADAVPNWFWRTMQYLVLGNKWVRV